MEKGYLYSSKVRKSKLENCVPVGVLNDQDLEQEQGVRLSLKRERSMQF